MLAAINDTGYKIMLFLHIVTAIVAFAPAFVHPLLRNQTMAVDAGSRSKIIGMFVGNGRRLYAPALILTGLFGFGVQGMSDSLWKFSQTWIWLAALIWVAMNGVLHAMLLPAERALADGDEAAAKKVDTASMILTGLLIVTLYLMVFKPGV